MKIRKMDDFGGTPRAPRLQTPPIRFFTFPTCFADFFQFQQVSSFQCEHRNPTDPWSPWIEYAAHGAHAYCNYWGQGDQ